MFCFQCGTKQADDALFCGACGTKLPTASQPAPEAPPALRPPAPVEAKAGTGWPTPPDAAARKTTAVSGSPGDAALTVETWTVTCLPPDGDGDSSLSAKAVVVYEGEDSAHLARLRWVVSDADGFPVGQGDGDLQQDIDGGDDIEVAASTFVRLGAGVTANAGRAWGQVIVFAGAKGPLLTAPLPEAGATGGKVAADGATGLEVMGWRCTCAASSDESASCRFAVAVRKTGDSRLAAVTLRVRVLSRKGDVWSTEYLVAESLAGGEVRVLETTLGVYQNARARRGATIEVVSVACHQPVVIDLPAVTPTLEVAESRDSESSGEGDGNGDEADEPTSEEEGLRGSDLLVAVREDTNGTRDDIVQRCGYSGPTCYSRFYAALIEALGLADIQRDSRVLEESLHEHWGNSPMIEDGTIYGRRTIRISAFARRRTWTAATWSRDNDEGNLEGPYEVGDPHGSRGYWTGYYDYASAMASAEMQSCPPVDLVRPAYWNLGSDAEGSTIEEFLAEHGEHPAELLALRERFRTELDDARPSLEAEDVGRAGRKYRRVTAGSEPTAQGGNAVLRYQYFLTGWEDDLRETFLDVTGLTDEFEGADDRRKREIQRRCGEYLIESLREALGAEASSLGIREEDLTDVRSGKEYGVLIRAALAFADLDGLFLSVSAALPFALRVLDVTTLKRQTYRSGEYDSGDIQCPDDVGYPYDAAVALFALQRAGLATTDAVRGVDADRLLQGAAECGDVQVMDLAVAKGGQIAGAHLVSAAGAPTEDGLKAVRYLLGLGFPLDALDERGRTPLIAAAAASAENAPDVVEYLLRQGASLDAVADDGTSALIAAAGARSKSSLATLKTLLHKGANVASATTEGRTALHAAVDGCLGDEELEKVKLLVAAGADVNAATDSGMTPLLYAVRENFGDRALDVVKALIAAGAALTGTTTDGETVADMVDPGNEEMGDYLRGLMRKGRRH